MLGPRLLARLEAEWRALQDSIAGATDAALLEPGAVGEWSVRDVLCHLTTWEEEFLKALPLVLERKPFPRYGGIAAFNRREQERKRRLSLEQVRREMDRTHARVRSALEAVGDLDPAVERRLRHRLRLDTYAHYREHAAQLAAWRQSGAGR